MPLAIDGLLLDQLSSDPGSPQEGQAWYNSTTFLFKVYRNAATTNLVDNVAFTNHTSSTSNPHSTTLEQARTAGSTLSGSINMGGFAITNVGSGSLGTDAAQRQWVSDTIKTQIQGLEFQDPVLNETTFTPPGSPTVGDRYIVVNNSLPINNVNTGTKTFTVTGNASALVAGNTFTVTGSTGNNGTYTVVSATFSTPNTAIVVTTTPPSAVADGNVNYSTGTWNAKATQIAQWNGTTWDFTVPVNGTVVLNLATNRLRLFTGTAWSAFEQNLAHGSLLGLANDDHTQYLLVNGTRAMTGALNMGSQNITNAGTINGVTITGHASRHNFGGADALDTSGTVVAITDATNAQGAAGGFALIGHQHAHGARGGGTLHAASSASAAGFQPQSNWAATTNPTVSNDNTQGYAAGSMWNNTSTGSSWVAISVATGAAVWKELTNIAGLLATKSGKVLAASFAGNPKKATVTFAAAFGSAAYAVTLTPIISVSGNTYAPNVESQVAGSFVINMGANNIGSLVSCSWVAVLNGEST